MNRRNFLKILGISGIAISSGHAIPFTKTEKKKIINKTKKLIAIGYNAKVYKISTGVYNVVFDKPLNDSNYMVSIKNKIAHIPIVSNKTLSGFEATQMADLSVYDNTLKCKAWVSFDGTNKCKAWVNFDGTKNI